MKFETLIYIIAGIIFIIYRHYKQSQKAKQTGPANKNTPQAEEHSYEQESPDSDILSLGNIFEEYQLKEKKYQPKIEKKETILDTIPKTEPKVLYEEGGRLTETVSEKPYVIPEPIIAKAELPTERVSDILRKYKENIKKENLSSPVFQNAEIEKQEKEFHFDAREAFIYSEIFKRKYE